MSVEKPKMEQGDSGNLEYESSAVSERQRLPGPSKGCNCRQSKCIKLYCECYQANVCCDSSCHCIKCQNNITNNRFREIAMKQTLERNPTAFQPKIKAGDQQVQDPLILGRHNKVKKSNQVNKICEMNTSILGRNLNIILNKQGCACRKSGCMKKYCECFQAKVPCSEICKCTGCRNHGFLTREHFMRAINNNEDSSQQNIFYQLLLAKDKEHMQSLISDPSLLGMVQKPFLTLRDIEDLCKQMVEIANYTDEQVETLPLTKLIRVEKSHKYYEPLIKIELKEQISNGKDDDKNSDMNNENGDEDLVCKESLLDKIKEDPSSSSFEDDKKIYSQIRRQMILELFINQLKQIEQ